MAGKTKEDFIRQVKIVHNNFYDYTLVEYKNNSTKVIIICPIHGEFLQIPKDHLNGRGCKKCGLIKQGISGRLTQEQFIDKANKIHNFKYDYSKTEYITSNKKIVIICPEHGEFEQIANDHLRGFGCSKCSYEKLSKNKIMTREEFEQKSKQIHGDKYNYSKADIVDERFRRIIICSIHGEFKQTPNNHINNETGCPKCKESKGEIKIREWLESKNIKFISQEWFKCSDNQCRNIETNWPLKFDFYLPNNNICIEYDGIQHYKSISIFGGDSGLLETKQRDQIKTKYCLDNNIKLLRIPYWKFSNIEIILESTIK